MALSILLSCAGLAPEDRTCGAHGTCILPIESCLCDSGYSSVSDVVGGPVQECYVNTDAVFALWILNLIIWGAHTIRAATLIDWRAPLAEMVQVMREKPAFLALMLHVPFGFGFSVLSLYKVAHYPDPIPAIGHDIFATIVYVVSNALLYLAMGVYMLTWHSVLLASNTAISVGTIQKALKRVKRGAAAVWVLVLLNNMMLFAIYDRPDEQEKIGAAYWVIRGFYIYSLAALELMGARKLLRVLEQFSDKDADGQAVISPMTIKFKEYITNLLIVSFLIGAFNIVVGLWPYARTLGAYFMPVTTVLGAWSAIKHLHTLPQYRVQAKSPSQKQLVLAPVGSPRLGSPRNGPRPSFQSVAPASPSNHVGVLSVTEQNNDIQLKMPPHRMRPDIYPNTSSNSDHE